MGGIPAFLPNNKTYQMPLEGHIETCGLRVRQKKIISNANELLILTITIIWKSADEDIIYCKLSAQYITLQMLNEETLLLQAVDILLRSFFRHRLSLPLSKRAIISCSARINLRSRFELVAYSISPNPRETSEIKDLGITFFPAVRLGFGFQAPLHVPWQRI